MDAVNKIITHMNSVYYDHNRQKIILSFLLKGEKILLQIVYVTMFGLSVSYHIMLYFISILSKNKLKSQFVESEDIHRILDQTL